MTAQNPDKDADNTERPPARRQLAPSAAGHGGRHDLPRLRFRCGRRRGRGDRLQHRHHRLPGGPHRPLVPRPDRHHDGAGDRQRRREPVRFRVAASVLRRLRGARAVASGVQLAGRGEPPFALRRQRRRRHHRHRHPGGDAPDPSFGRAAGHHHARGGRCGRRGGARAPAPLAGRARPRARGDRCLRLRVGRAGVAGAARPRRLGGGAARQISRGRLRLRHQARHLAAAAFDGLPGQRRSGDHAGARSAGDEARRHLPVEWPRRSGGRGLRRRGHARALPVEAAGVRDLPRPSDSRASPWAARPTS